MAVNPADSAKNVTNLLAAGIPKYYIDQNKGGAYVNNNEYSSISNSWKTSPYNIAGQQAKSGVPTLGDLASQKYQFDPNQYLPGIQQTAGSIYDPQRAQIDALSKLQASQAEQSRIRTQEDFAKEMTAKVEAINARGAFFGGGAINQQGDIAKRENYALTDINLQDQAAQAGMLAQKAGLSAAQAEYIQQKLTGVENSAYSRFTDNRNFLLSLSTEERNQLESDREFQENVRQFGLNYALDKKRLKLQEKTAKGDSGSKTIKYEYSGLPTKKDVNINYSGLGGGGLDIDSI